MGVFSKLFGRRGDAEPPEQARQLFNEGVAASLDASDFVSRGDLEKAKGQSQQAIDRFRAALKMAPDSSSIAGALGHELYVHANTFGGGGFAEAAELLLKASRSDPKNVAFLCELGLCQTNMGDLPAAQQSFERVFELDDSRETRDHVAAELGAIGQRAFEYGKALQQEGQEEHALSYKRFAIGASMLAYRTHESRRELARQVSAIARDIGDVATAEKYEALAARMPDT